MLISAQNDYSLMTVVTRGKQKSRIEVWVDAYMLYVASFLLNEFLQAFQLYYACSCDLGFNRKLESL